LGLGDIVDGLLAIKKVVDIFGNDTMTIVDVNIVGVRQEAEFPDCLMLSYSFRISLLQHASLVTDSCEACETTWKKSET